MSRHSEVMVCTDRQTDRQTHTHGTEILPSQVRNVLYVLDRMSGIPDENENPSHHRPHQTTHLIRT